MITEKAMRPPTYSRWLCAIGSKCPRANCTVPPSVSCWPHRPGGMVTWKLNGLVLRRQRPAVGWRGPPKMTRHRGILAGRSDGNLCRIDSISFSMKITNSLSVYGSSLQRDDFDAPSYLLQTAPSASITTHPIPPFLPPYKFGSNSFSLHHSTHISFQALNSSRMITASANGCGRHPWVGLGLQLVALLLMAVFCDSSAALSSAVRPLLKDKLVTSNNHSDTFDTNYQVTWGNALVKFLDNRRTVQLGMDRSSGSGFASRSKYLFGYFSTQIKLIPGDASGTLSLQQSSQHDELDMEFLGNRAGQPHYLSINVFFNGVGNRESRVRLWFDATAGFHTYSILWNRNIIIFMVDQVPIRVFKNAENSVGVAYPSAKPMQVIASLWNGEDWATDGGKAKINWRLSPFVASFRGFGIKGQECYTRGASVVCPSSVEWEGSGNAGLTRQQLSRFRWVRKNYMTYDYCTDKSRYPSPPPECSVNSI
eukprot:Gb_07550 [translate_table: standard]